MLPMRPHKPYKPNDQQAANDQIELMEVLAQITPILRHLHTRVGESKAPRPRSDKGIDVKSPARHAPDPRGERNERSDYRQHARNQDGDLAELVKQPVREFEVAFAQQHVAAILLNQRAPTISAHFV